MKSSTKRALSLLLSAALLIAALAIYATLIVPEYDVIQGLRGTIEAKTQVLDLETKAVQQVKSLIVNLKNISNISASLSSALPSDQQLATAVAQLNALAQVHGLAVQGIGVTLPPVMPSPVSQSFAKNIGTLRFDVKFAGTYSGMRDFLYDVERNLRIMDVQGLTVDSSTKSGQDLVTFSAVIDTYYQTP
ncbi:MAG: type 4a pilus biogenesis protein PilO [Patescibacteria group bacterium]|nr:type 4a pilus biogenesis protein PilO [Patescibacteria group bacterium]